MKKKIFFDIPRSMIPEEVFREFPAETCRKRTVSGQNPPKNARNSMQESGDRIRLPVLPGSCLLRAEPDKSFHRNTASMKSPELSGTNRFRAGLFDLGIFKRIGSRREKNAIANRLEYFR
jgi:hypothetical protein